MLPLKNERDTGNRLLFIFLYGLAFIGSCVAYIPMFSFVLPAMVEAMAFEQREVLLTQMTFAGAIVASGAGILFGILSDRMYWVTGSRRLLIGFGLILLLFATLGIASSDSFVPLFIAVLLFQAALNMMLASLMAVLADDVPDRRKGIVSGIFCAGAPSASIIGAMVSRSVHHMHQPIIFWCIAATLIIPFLFFRGQRPGVGDGLGKEIRGWPGSWRVLGLAWAARLSVQLAAVAVTTYFYFFLSDRLPLEAHHIGDRMSTIAAVMAWASVAAVAVTLLASWTSDRTGRRKPMIGASSVIMAAGLMLMAFQPQWELASLGYGLFMLGFSTFNALHCAFTAQILPSPSHRARDLALFNLTNTLPALAGPLLVMTIMGSDVFFETLWSVSALLCLLGGIVMQFARGHR